MKDSVGKQTKRIRTTIAIDVDVWQKGRMIADQDRRDFSAEIEVLILEEVRRRARSASQDLAIVGSTANGNGVPT